jgi:hypothetical protein
MLFNNGYANIALSAKFAIKGERRKMKGYNTSEMMKTTVTGWQKLKVKTER